MNGLFPVLRAYFGVRYFVTRIGYDVAQGRRWLCYIELTVIYVLCLFIVLVLGRLTPKGLEGFRRLCAYSTYSLLVFILFTIIFQIQKLTLTFMLRNVFNKVEYATP